MEILPAYLILDTETTGLRRRHDEIWSLSFALETAEEVFADKTYSVAHTAPPSKFTMQDPVS